MARRFLSNLNGARNNQIGRRHRRKAERELALSTKLGREYKRRTKGVKVGTGERFGIMEETLAKKPGVKTPGALAAWIGRRKYGAKRFAGMAAAGRKRRA